MLFVIYTGTAKFVLGMDTGVLKGHMPEESKAFIKNVQDYLSLSAETVREPPFLRSFLETRSWKAASKAHNTLLQIGAKVNNQFLAVLLILSFLVVIYILN